jgi:hypothetical protein
MAASLKWPRIEEEEELRASRLSGFGTDDDAFSYFDFYCSVL